MRGKIMYDYANILFTGPCNLRCYECIGKNPALKELPWNNKEFPIKNIDDLLDIVNEHVIPDLSFTGTNMDPQIYRHEKELIDYVRERLNDKTKLSLHTNGLRALKDMDLFNSYDKASISYHSFNPRTYNKITGGRQPDIAEIVKQAKIPIKLSLLVTPHNQHEIEEYISRSKELGIKRLVVRKLKGRDEEFPLEQQHPFNQYQPKKAIFGWPVYDINGMEVTVCGFDESTARGVFLFSDGRIANKLV